MAEIKELPQVTLISVAGNKHGETIASMYKSMGKIKFGAVKLLTNIDLSATGIEVINVGGLSTWAEYNHFIVKELYKYFSTDFCLICQYDSWVLDAECWTDDFLGFDLIGARGLSDGRTNFNGGFTLRSWKFQKAIAKDDFISITAPEDEILCRLYRNHIEENYNFKYCTPEVADKFAFELHEPLAPTFGFHNFHWKPYRETIVFKRHHACGDIIMLEVVMHYFHQKGYQVALDTQPEYLRLFFQHYFPVVPKAHLNPKLPYREIDFNMAYEIKPKQLVLKSYFEMAGVKDYVLRNSRLHLIAGENQKLLQKYVVIHINRTNLEYRNIHGLDWQPVIKYLKKRGYQVFQIGKDVHDPIATYFNTMTLEFMMFFIKGADLVIASDSGPAQIAVAFDIPSVIFFGSVNPKYRYHNFDKIQVVQSPCTKKETQHCYHNEVAEVGSECIYDKKFPPCTQYSSEQVINAIKELV